jgi:hypothetical protein
MPILRLAVTTASNSPVTLSRTCLCSVCRVISHLRSLEGQAAVWGVIREQKVAKRRRMEWMC